MFIARAVNYELFADKDYPLLKGFQYCTCPIKLELKGSDIASLLPTACGLFE